MQIPISRFSSSRQEQTTTKVRSASCSENARAELTSFEQILESIGLEFVSVDASLEDKGLTEILVDVKNMQNDGINEKATFYVDTKESSHLRGRKSIVPYVPSLVLS